MSSHKSILDVPFVRSCELLPSRKKGLDDLSRIKSSFMEHLDMVTAPNNPRGIPGIDPLLALWEVTRDSSVIATPHISPRDLNRLALYSRMITALKFDINHFFIVGGDSISPKVNSNPVGELDVLGMIHEVSSPEIYKEYLRNFDGDIFSGSILNQFRPKEEELVKIKMERGASFFITHSIYDTELVKQDWIKNRKFKLLGGFIPIFKPSFLQNAQALDIAIPKDLKEKILNSTDLESFFINFISEKIDELKGYVDGFHVMPLGRTSFTKKLLEVI